MPRAAYLITGLGVILLGFGGNRFAAYAAQGYFTNVIRIGVRPLYGCEKPFAEKLKVPGWNADTWESLELAAAVKKRSWKVSDGMFERR